MNRSKFWTTAEIDELKRLAAKGKRCPEIGEALGRSAASVNHRGRALGLRFKRGGGVRKCADPFRLATSLASESLARRICAAMQRFANDNKLNERDAFQLLMGGQYSATVPGTEATMKTCAVERLVA